MKILCTFLLCLAMAAHSLLFQLDSQTVAYWRLTGETGVVRDLGPNGLDGNAYNVIPEDSATHFSGTGTSYAQFPSLDAFLPPDCFTLQARVRVDEYPDYEYPDYGASIAGYAAWLYGDRTFGYELRLIMRNGQCYPELCIGDEGYTWEVIRSNTPVQLNAWTVLAAQFDGITLSFFMNGALKAQLAHTVPMKFNGSDFYVGRRGPGTPDWAFHGCVSEVAVSKTVRYPVDPLPRDTHTVALYHFNEKGGDTAHDASGYGNHLRVYNGVWSNGIRDGSLAFNGLSTYAEASSTSSLVSFDSGITIEALVTVEPTGVEWEHIIDKPGTYGLSYHYGHPAMLIDGVGWWWTPDNFDAPFNRWVVLAGQFDRRVQRLFVNERLVAERFIGGTVSYTYSFPLRVGVGYNYGTLDYWFKGRIDELRISDNPRLAIRQTRPIWPPESCDVHLGDTLRWTRKEGRYDLEIGRSLCFCGGKFAVQGVTDTCLPLVSLLDGASGLSPDSLLYWRVRSCDGVYQSWWSPISTFFLQPVGNEYSGDAGALPDLMAFPNPFTPHSRISFSLSSPVHARLLIYDCQGKRVRIIFDGPAQAGLHGPAWAGDADNGEKTPSGVYMAVLKAGRQHQVRKLFLIR